MAFAPPRKSARAPPPPSTIATKTRIPLISPSKKAVEVVPTSETLAKRSTIVPSRYLQDATRGPLQSRDKATTFTSTHVKQASNTTGLQRVLATNSRPLPSSASQSPSKRTSGPPSKSDIPGDDQARDFLRIRLSHTLMTCDAGEANLTSLRDKAECELKTRWETAKEQALRVREASDCEQLQTDVNELAQLSTEDVLALETYISRVDHIRDDLGNLRDSIRAWSDAPRTAPPKSWDSAVQVHLDSCDAAHLVARSLVQRFHDTGRQGVVSRLLDDISTILNLVREELTLLEAHYHAIWARKRREVESRYAALTEPYCKHKYQPLWQRH